MPTSNHAGPKRPRSPRSTMGRGHSDLCLWRLSGRYSVSGGLNRGWTRSRPHLFEPQTALEVEETEGYTWQG